MRFVLPAIWATAALGLAGGLGAMLWWAGIFDAGGYFEVRDGALWNFLAALGEPLLIIGVLATVAAFTVHAVLWRRSRITPPEAPSP